MVKLTAFIFFWLAAFLNVQPLISSQPTATKMKCCAKKMKCRQKKEATSNPCANDSCNPFMACAFGNFYVLQKSGIDFHRITIKSVQPLAINDNRLADNVPDCWHPPQASASPKA